MQKMIMITDFKMLIWRQARATSDNLLYRNIFWEIGSDWNKNICLNIKNICNSRDVPIGVHDVDVHGSGRGHAGVAVAARVRAEVGGAAVGDLEALGREVVRRVGAQVHRVHRQT